MRNCWRLWPTWSSRCRSYGRSAKPRANPAGAKKPARATSSTLSDVGSADTPDVLADTAGNQCWRCCANALEEAVATQAAQMRAAGSGARDPDRVTYSHAHIVDAVREKDAAEAARRVRRHLGVPLQSQDGQEVAGVTSQELYKDGQVGADRKAFVLAGGGVLQVHAARKAAPR